jgi:hypothetical protein
VAAHAQVVNGRLSMKAISFVVGPVRRDQGESTVEDAVRLGEELASRLRD